MAQVLVSIGSNIDKAANIRSGVQALRAHYGVLILSPVYESQAVGFAGDNFYNLVAAFDTHEDVATVVRALRGIEQAHARARDGKRFNSRTLDLDLLLYDQLILDEGDVQVPRDEILHYAFVLKPLADIAAGQRHPQTQQTFSDLWQAFGAQPQQVLWVVDFQW